MPNGEVLYCDSIEQIIHSMGGAPKNSKDKLFGDSTVMDWPGIQRKATG
jgi:hypothetical protein